MPQRVCGSARSARPCMVTHRAHPMSCVLKRAPCTCALCRDTRRALARHCLAFCDPWPLPFGHISHSYSPTVASQQAMLCFVCCARTPALLSISAATHIAPPRGAHLYLCRIALVPLGHV
eukprot:5477871-Pleurochrysis_carterae.AAC.2